MFAKELVMYVDYVSELSLLTDPEEPGWRKLLKMRKNLEQGMDLCMEIANGASYPGENLESLRETVNVQREKLNEIFDPELAQA
jgi:hypothetical protein